LQFVRLRLLESAVAGAADCRREEQSDGELSFCHGRIRVLGRGPSYLGSLRSSPPGPTPLGTGMAPRARRAGNGTGSQRARGFRIRSVTLDRTRQQSDEGFGVTATGSTWAGSWSPGSNRLSSAVDGVELGSAGFAVARGVGAAFPRLGGTCSTPEPGRRGRAARGCSIRRPTWCYSRFTAADRSPSTARQGSPAEPKGEHGRDGEQPEVMNPLTFSCVGLGVARSVLSNTSPPDLALDGGARRDSKRVRSGIHYPGLRVELLAVKEQLVRNGPAPSRRGPEAREDRSLGVPADQE
jgi:hypothetical protein